MKIALLTYNRIIKYEKSGWRGDPDNRVLIIQNDGVEEWASENKGDRDKAEWQHKLKRIIESLWAEFLPHLSTVDKIMIYVGNTGSERIIELLAEHGIDPERLIFALCECNYWEKRMLISEKLYGSTIIKCECGGQKTMFQIYHDFLANGTPPNWRAYQKDERN